MSNSNEKYIGESLIREEPGKKLKLKIGDKVIKKKHLSDEVSEVFNDVDNLQNEIDSLEVAGIALSNDYGSNPLIGISQMKLTESYNEQTEKNAQYDETLNEHTTELENTYRKSETYSREQLDNLITTPDQQYVTVTATVGTTSVTDVLPATGEAHTIYRVGNWDGTGYDEGGYTEYAWDGTQYIPLSVKEPGIDDEPVAGSNNLVKSGGIADTVLPYINKVEFETSYITTTVSAFKGFLIDFKMLTEKEDGYDYGLYHICNGLPEGVSYTYYLGVLKFPTGEIPTRDNVVAVATFSSTTKPDNGLIIFGNSDSTVRAAAVVNWDAIPAFGSGSNFVPFKNTSVFNQSYIFNLDSGIIPTLLSLDEIDAKVIAHFNNLVISLVGDNPTQNYDDVDVTIKRYGAAVCLYDCIGRVFNTIEIPFYASSELNVPLRIGQTDIVTYSNDMFADAMLEDNILLSTTFDIQGFAGYQKIHLESPIVVSKKTLVICTSTNSSIIYNPYQASSVGMVKNAGFCLNNTGTIYIYSGRAEYNAYGVSPKIYLSTASPDVIQTVDVFLPNRLYAVVGDTMQLFYRGAIKAPNPFNYDIVAVCNKGSDYPRYYEYKPSANNVGTTSFTLYVKDRERKILGQKSCTLVTVSANEPSSEKKILCFGDSLTSAGVWCHEADRRLTGTGGSPAGLGFSNISFCGKKTNEGTGYFGNGGWTWDSYTTEGRPAYRFYVNGVNTINVGAIYTNNGNTFAVIEVNVTDGTGNILCSVTSLSPAPLASGTLTKSSGSGDDSIIYTSCAEDTQNPLWDSSNNKMSFIPYVEAYAGGNVDAVYVLLSWNGLTPGKTDFSTILANVKIFADTLHSEYPNAKLKLMGLQMNSVNGGMGANYGATGVYSDDYGMLTTAFNLNKAYQEFADNDDYSSFVEYVDIACQFDTDYNMQSRNKYVNTRNTAVTEVIGTNGVHPDTTGYYQIADVVFRNIVANFCQ